LADNAIDEVLRGYRDTGFGYVDYVEQQGYGISLSSPSVVVLEILRHPHTRLLTYTEQGWNSHQDAVAYQCKL